MELIDSHCHLTFPGLLDRIDDVIAGARAAGVSELVTVATDLADAERAIGLSDRFPEIHVAAGVHPHEAGKVAPGWDEALAQVVQRDDVFAVGETGLDYHYDFADRAAQGDVFRRQLELASAVGKPVIIHCREAQAEALDVLAAFDDLAGVVFHCFTGTETEAAELLERGYWISLTGVVTFKRSDELRRVARMIPAERLMIETDSPYLSPEPLRNVRPNEPAHLIHTARRIAEARDISVDELATLTTGNARRFFSLKSE